jgi:hypothetical protein
MKAVSIITHTTFDCAKYPCAPRMTSGPCPSQSTLMWSAGGITPLANKVSSRVIGTLRSNPGWSAPRPPRSLAFS